MDGPAVGGGDLRSSSLWDQVDLTGVGMGPPRLQHRPSRNPCQLSAVCKMELTSEDDLLGLLPGRLVDAVGSRGSASALGGISVAGHQVA